MRAELNMKPRDLWSRGSDATMVSELGMPAKTMMRPQDAVFGGKASLGRVGKEEFKDRFRSPYATHVAKEHDFAATEEWNRTH